MQQLLLTFKHLAPKEQLGYLLMGMVIFYHFLHSAYDIARPFGEWYAVLHLIIIVSFSYFTLHYIKYKNVSLSVYGVLSVSSLYLMAVLYLNEFTLYSYFLPILLPIGTYLVLSFKESILFILLHYTILTLLSFYGYYELGIQSQAFNFISIKVYIFIVTFMLLFGMVYHLAIGGNYKILFHDNHKKEIALSEIHHRVKNNLGIISSIMSIQNFGAEHNDLHAVMQDNKTRIEALLLIHQLLYKQKNFESIRFETYLNELCHSLLKESDGNIKVEKEVGDFYFSIKVMQHFGILLNELITNSLKHAFDTIEDPLISISLKQEKNLLCFLYWDNGTGCNQARIEQNKTLGMSFIRASAKQLKGTIQCECKEGFKCEILLDVSLQTHLMPTTRFYTESLDA